MAIMRPVQEPIVGFGVSAEGVQNAVGAAAPLIQASQSLKQMGIDEEKKQQAINYQKLLRSGADGMRSYAQDVSGLYPELGKQIAQEAEQYATFFSDPSLTGEKAEQYASNFYESANNRIKFADENAKKEREEREKKDKFGRFQSEFVPTVESLVQQSKSKPETVSDIATRLAKSEHAGEPYAEKFIDNLKQERFVNTASVARQDLSQVISLENSLRDEYNKKIASVETATTAFRKLSQALERNNPADAYSAIINYVRTLDPGSTVREAEERLARERSAGGPLGALGQYIENLKGGKLTDPIRKNLLEAGKGLVMAELEGYKTVRADYAGKVRNYKGRGVDIDEFAVVGDDLAAKLEKELGRDIFNPQGKKAVPKISLKAGEPITPDNIGGVDDDALERRRQELLNRKNKGGK